MDNQNAKYEALLRRCLEDYSHPNFNDRHGMADRIRAALGIKEEDEAGALD
jgi:hypothetical protein